MLINLCLQILNATDALKKIHERKKDMILEDARMQKLGAPLVKKTRHRDRLDKIRRGGSRPFGTSVRQGHLRPDPLSNDVNCSKVLQQTTWHTHCQKVI